MNRGAERYFLNAGAGGAGGRAPHPGFASSGWREVRLDIDPNTDPDIVSSICDMRANVSDARFDGIWTSHTIEHLHAHQVILAFREFRRVLKSDGFALVTCPDLAAIARLVAAGDLETVVYRSPAGPIRPIDMLFGLGRAIEEGRLSMAHNTGYTAERLGRVALDAGFAEARVVEGGNYDLWALLLAPEARMEDIAAMFVGTNFAELFDETEEEDWDSQVRTIARAR